MRRQDHVRAPVSLVGMNVPAVRGALVRYRVMAWVTGVVLAFMTVVGLPFKYLFDGQATWYSVGWVAHGWLYVLYVVTAVDLAFRLRYSVPRTLAMVLAGTIPFASFFAEHYVTKDVHARIAATEPAPAAAEPA